MSERIETINALIDKTMLGIEDHGCFTFMLHLNFDGGGQGAGGYVLGGMSGIPMIRAILETVGVMTWEELPGNYIRIKASHTKVHDIGHIIKEKWLNFEQFFEAQKLKEKEKK